MIVVNRGKLTELSKKYPESRSSVESLLKEIETSEWTCSQDVKSRYPKAHIIGGKCIVFEIGGNKYRVVVKINYEKRIVSVDWSGKHSEYDKLVLKGK